jgi:hypothetical protein
MGCLGLIIGGAMLLGGSAMAIAGVYAAFTEDDLELWMRAAAIALLGGMGGGLAFVGWLILKKSWSASNPSVSSTSSCADHRPIKQYYQGGVAIHPCPNCGKRV